MKRFRKGKFGIVMYLIFLALPLLATESPEILDTTAVAIDVDRRLLAYGSQSGRLVVWDIETVKVIQDLSLPSPILSLRFSRLRPWLAALDQSGRVSVWQIPDFRKIFQSRNEIVTIDGQLRFSENGLFLGVVADKVLRVWQTKDWSLAIKKSKVNRLTALAFSNDSKQLAFAGYDGTVNLLALDDQTVDQTLSTSAFRPYALSFGPGDKVVSGGGAYNRVNSWTLRDGLVQKPLIGHASFVTGLAYIDNGQQLLSASLDGDLALWSLEERRLSQVFSHRKPVQDLDWDELARLAAVSTKRGGIVLWSLQDYQPVATFFSSQDGQHGVHVPAGRYLSTRPDTFDYQQLGIGPLKNTFSHQLIGVTDVHQTLALATVVRKGRRASFSDALKAYIEPKLKHRKRWAVLIGIDEYNAEKNGYEPLPYAVNDAVAVQEYLLSAGYDKNHIIMLKNSKATRIQMDNILGDVLPKLMGEEDQLLIYFSGHGETRQRPDGRAGGYLIPYDGNYDALHASSISMTNLHDYFALLPAKQILVVIDACYSGIAGLTFKGNRFNNISHQTSFSDYKTFFNHQSRMILTAGSSDQEVAMAAKWNNHSLFTYTFLQGLSEKHADLNQDGFILINELAAYLDNQFLTQSQTPQLFRISGEGQFVFY